MADHYHRDGCPATRLLPVPDVCRLLGLSWRQVNRLIRSGAFGTVPKNGRRYLVPEDRVLAYRNGERVAS